MARLDASLTYGLMNPTYQKELGQVGGMLGGMGAHMRQTRRDKEQAQEMAGMSPLEQIKYAQQNVAKTPQEQLELSKGLAEARTASQEGQLLNRRREALAQAARKLGNEDLAGRIQFADHKELDTIGKEIRAEETAQMKNLSAGTRRGLLLEKGFSPEEIAGMNLRSMDADRFNKLLNSKKADAKVFSLNGETQVLQVNDAGMVKDPDSGSWVVPSSLDLKEAPPQVQQVLTIGDEMGTQLAKVGAKKFDELHDKAQSAKVALTSVGDSMPLVDNMYTGAFADTKLNIARYAKAFGIDLGEYDKIAKTEDYVAVAGKRVADYITNLGAGTGLSDADREYAEKVTAGLIKADKDGLKLLLAKVKRDSLTIINTYNATRSDILESLPEESQDAMGFFPRITTEEPSTVNDDMATYLN